MHSQSRRDWLTAGVAAAASMSLANSVQAEPKRESLSPHSPISTQAYPWLTFAKRNNEPFTPHSEELIGKIAASGITGYEPIVGPNESLEGLDRRLGTFGLRMPTVYMNSVLHDEAESAASINTVITSAGLVQKLGTQIIVTNPTPIRWGGDENKSDRQLAHQAESLNELGRQLKAQGLVLAYHNHDAELRAGGREFHHMLAATDPDNVKLCLDAHWIYRGCGNSFLAVVDAMRNYEDRIVELHLRQSHGGIWGDVFSLDGDLDYRLIFDRIADAGLNPHLVLEQAIEEGSPKENSVVSAHQKSADNLSEFLRERFGPTRS